MKTLKAVDNKYTCQILTKHCKAITNMATMHNSIMSSRGRRYLEYVCAGAVHSSQKVKR